MKKKKGFTLIELLAVIVILAIIMVIAVPKILDVIEQAERQAYEDSVNLMVSAVKLRYQTSDITGEDKLSLPSVFEYEIDEEGSKTVTVGKAKELGCTVQGAEPVVEDKKPCELEVDATDSNILYVDSESDLYKLSNDVNSGTTYEGKTIVLRNNLDMSKVDATKYTCEAGGFNPIGTSSNPFKGSFEGSAKTISNLTVDKPSQNDVGLFGVVAGSTIRELNLKNISVTGNEFVGGLIGYISGGTIKEICLDNIAISGSNKVGGLIGEISGGTIKEICLDNIAISGYEKVGGLIGDVYNAGTYNNVLIKTGTVSASSRYAGYLAGYSSTIVKNAIAENLKVTGNSVYGTNSSYQSYSSTLSTLNGSSEANAFSSDNIGDLSYYTDKVETSINGDVNNTGYFFDYVYSKGGIYLVKKYTRTDSDDESSSDAPTTCTITSYGPWQHTCYLYSSGIHGGYQYSSVGDGSEIPAGACTSTTINGQKAVAAFRRKVNYTCR